MKGLVLVSPGGLSKGGGIGSVTRNIHGWMRQTMPATKVVVLDPRGDGPAVLYPAYLLYSAAALIWLRLTGQVDVLHLQVSERSSFIRKGLLLRLGRAMGMRTVLHHHGAELVPFYADASRGLKDYVAATARLADMNIVLGEQWARLLSNEMKVERARVTLAYNAVPALAPKGARKQGAPFHILMLANLSPRKGVGELLDALAMLAAQGLDFRATFAGGGEVERYKAQSAALGIGARCEFLGWIAPAQVPALIASSDTLVLPSYNEGLPMVILEALSAGLPVIATPVGSIPEVLRHDHDCLLVPVGDAAQLAAALLRVATDATLTERLAENGRRVFTQRFSLDAYMARLLALYEHLLDRPSGSVAERAGA